MQMVLTSGKSYDLGTTANGTLHALIKNVGKTGTLVLNIDSGSRDLNPGELIVVATSHHIKGTAKGNVTIEVEV